MTASLDSDWDAAIRHHRDGQLDQAETFYRSALARDSEDTEALNLLGALLQSKGAWQEALSTLRRATSIDPDFPEAAVNLARVLRLVGRVAEAAEEAGRAVSLDPGLPDARLQLGLAWLDLGETEKAADAFRRAIELMPNMPDAHFNLGLALKQLSEPAAATAAFRSALAFNPEQYAIIAMLASCLSECGQHEEAIDLLRRAVAKAPNDVDRRLDLAKAHMQSLDAAKAVEVLRATLEIAKENARVWTMLGSGLASMGHFEEAATSHRRALELDPDAVFSRRELLMLRAGDMQSDEAARLATRLSDDRTALDIRVTAGFALGDYLDQRGNYDDAFVSFAEANRLLRNSRIASGTAFDPVKFDSSIDEQISNFSSDIFHLAGRIGSPSDLPVFIVGQPRSGTSLVEQIVSSHSAVFGAGELTDIPRIVATLNEAERIGDQATWRAERVRREATAHIDRLRRLGGSAERVTDKLPDNIVNLGQIAILFPNASVIVCRRNLLDVGLSCFTKQFVESMTWSNHLDDIARRFVAVEKLMAHWRQILPIRFIEVSYEALIADLSGQSKRLIEFLGLQWEDNCLNFYQNPREVLTASRWQVRQPLYSSSVGRWKRYQGHLGSLIYGLRDLSIKEESW